ncbi:MAG: BtpA/SgcQ family protein [Chloroflexi bacterium]|nr:BtpA/SgcQ family protein [Chloroflexota bacterium]
MTRFREIFPNPKPIVGMIALPPLPGYPEFTRIDAYIERALGDLRALEDGGADGVCVENDYDHPHTLTGGPEIIASFTRIVSEVMRHARVPVGLEVLLNDWRASLAIALATGAQFIRMDFFVDRVRIKAGVIEPEPEAVLAYRARIRAEHVALFTDVQVKYSESLEPGKRLSTSVRQAVQHGADAVIVTGRETGQPPTLDDVREAREAAGDFPVLLGSGTAPGNAGALLRVADGALVGTSLKDGSDWPYTVVPSRVRALMDVVRGVRANPAL